VQENADPKVKVDLLAALDDLAPEHRAYTHAEEGPDDMPSHIKAMLTSVSLSIPMKEGCMLLGPWQGVYVNRAPRRAARAVDRAHLHWPPCRGFFIRMVVECMAEREPTVRLPVQRFSSSKILVPVRIAL
jgi:Uncharacterised protein family UPF0047